MPIERADPARRRPRLIRQRVPLHSSTTLRILPLRVGASVFLEREIDTSLRLSIVGTVRSKVRRNGTAR